MIAATLVPFLLLCLTVELTPGPNMAYLAILSLTAGRRSGYAATAGIALGLALVGIMAALGVATMVNESPWMLRALSWAGCSYLLWLAWDTWCDEVVPTPGKARPIESRSRYFRRGLITNLLNPKAIVFYAVLLPGFVGAGAASLSQILFLTGISVGIATSIHLIIVTLASRFAPFLSHPRRQRTVRRVMALMLVGIAAWFALSNMSLAGAVTQ